MSVLLSRARSGQCRAIVCEAVEPPSLKGDAFGKARICGEPVSGLTSYCAVHVVGMYQPGPRPSFAGEPSIKSRQPAVETQPDLLEAFA